MEEPEKTYYDKVSKNVDIFDEEYGLIQKNQKKASAALKERLQDVEVKETCAPSRLLDFVPILRWLPRYKWRENILSDLIGGLTVGIMHVPQGMAYSSLAGVPPVNGLYTSLFPALLYMVFGTSRHVSLGVFAVVSLMVGSCNVRVSGELFSREAAALNSTLIKEEQLMTDISLRVVTALTLLVGLVQLCMAVLRLDFLNDFLSDQVIAGFTTGAAVHVFAAQLNKILGVSLPRHSGFLRIYYMLADLASSVVAGKANVTTFAISLATIVVLFCAKNFLDPFIKKRLNTKLPIPYDLFVLIGGVIVSVAFGLHDKYHVKTIGHIPTGLPAVSVPDVTLFPYMIKDSIAISIVILVVTISMGKLFAKKHKYDIDVRQEFYALGVMECVCSLFPVWPASTALARTLVYEAAGTRSQLATVFSSALLLSVILFLGPLLEALPVCFLSCIIIVALQGMFMQLRQLAAIWPASKGDAAVFLVTFLCTVFYDVVEGLLLGVAFALALLIMRVQQAPLVQLGRMWHSGEAVYYRPLASYRDACAEEGVCCVRWEGALVFLNLESFRDQLDKAAACPEHHRRRNLVEVRKFSQHSRTNSGGGASVKLQLVEDKSSTLGSRGETAASTASVRLLVLDLSTVTHIDYMSANALIDIFNDKTNAGLQMRFSSPSLEIMRTFSRIDRFSSEMRSAFYPSIDDAINN